MKPFGFTIHACIDDHSRKIIWLDVASTNKDPSVVAGYLLKAVKSIGGLLLKIRSDDGSENSLIEAVQITIRSQRNDEYAGLGSYCVGTSTANQRIESLWLQFARDRPFWWRQFFAQLSDLVFIDAGDPVSRECIRYCFMNLLQQELNDFTERWNRQLQDGAPSKGANFPRGQPISLYHLPELFGSIS